MLNFLVYMYNIGFKIFLKIGFFLILSFESLFAQNIIEWSDSTKLTLSDFQSKTSKIGGNIYSLYSSSKMDFSFSMSNYEFMFTKNFNSKVSCNFTKDAASIIAPDEETANSLVQFAQFDFDLSELYARKFRKKLFEEKGAFSDVSFFHPIYDRLQKEFVEKHTDAVTLTDIGRDNEKLIELHEDVLRQIKELSQFCKTCKPLKQKSK